MDSLIFEEIVKVSKRYGVGCHTPRMAGHSLNGVPQRQHLNWPLPRFQFAQGAGERSHVRARLDAALGVTLILFCEPGKNALAAESVAASNETRYMIFVIVKGKRVNVFDLPQGLPHHLCANGARRGLREFVNGL